MKIRHTWYAVLAIVLVAFVALALYCRPSTEDQELVVLSYGGEFAEAQRAAFFDPFSEESGIEVVDVSYGGEYGTLKSAVESGSVQWDVVDIESSALLRGKRDGILLPIDYGQVDASNLIHGARDEYGVATDFYSVSMGWNSDEITDPPTTWADFWDTTKYPGPRTLKKDPRFTLEIALMADGVPLEEVYSESGMDLDRAFASLDRIKPYVKVWWSTGQQPIQLLANGEVTLGAAFGARMYNARHKDNLPVGMRWDQGILDVEYWAIPKGAPNPDLAHRFINFASAAEPQAAFPRYIPLGPVNLGAFEVMDSEFAEQLNTHPSNLRKQLLLDAEYWADNELEVLERFNQWLSE